MEFLNIFRKQNKKELESTPELKKNQLKKNQLKEEPAEEPAKEEPKDDKVRTS